MLGALNKLNDKNYDAVAKTVKALLEGLGPEHVAKAVLKQAVLQSSYASTFANLLSDLWTSLPAGSDAAAEFQAQLDAFCTGFLEFRFLDDLLLTAGAEPTHDYDAFCAHVRDRAHALGRTRMALLLCRRAGAMHGERGMVAALYAQLQAASSPDEGQAPCWVRLDVLLDMLSEVRRMRGKALGDGVVTRLLETRVLPMAQLPPKLRFKVLDLLGR